MKNPNPGKRRLLLISNGHGEDSLAVRVFAELHPLPDDLEVHAWPMVGEGGAYRNAGIEVVGEANFLPGEGFGTLSLPLFLRDLRAGWLRTHYRQWRCARRMRGRYSLALAVGDIVPLLAAVVSRTPFLFLGCAKSAYYRQSYTRLEKRLLRRHCMLAFPRDTLTHEELEAAGVRSRDAGNPMMDGLEMEHPILPLDEGATVVALLPGSRRDAVENALHLLHVAEVMHSRAAGLDLLFMLAPAPEFERQEFLSRAAEVQWRPGEQQESTWKLHHAGGTRAWLVANRFAEVLDRSSLVLGLAGTANEQAIGLGKPLVTFPTGGAQGPAYVRMKMEYFGDAAVATSGEPRETAAAALKILADIGTQNRMADAGRLRMGGPGASRAIALALRNVLQGMAP